MKSFVAISGEKSFFDPNSPQSKAAEWIINEDPLNVNPCTFSGLAQRYAMVVFYFALDGDDWIYNEGWLGGTSMCVGWQKVSCDRDGLVSSLLLSRNNLVGKIPREVKELTGMQLFQAYDNEISGRIPTEIGLLQNMVGFDIESNKLEGELFFDEVFELTNIQFFRASGNQFSGTVPWNNVITSFPKLKQFWIAKNR